MTKNHGLITSSLEYPGLFQRPDLEVLGLSVSSRGGQAKTHRLGGKHLRMSIADPHRRLQCHSHIIQAAVEVAGVDPAVPHHDAIGDRNPCQIMPCAEADASSKVG